MRTRRPSQELHRERQCDPHCCAEESLPVEEGRAWPRVRVPSRASRPPVSNAEPASWKAVKGGYPGSDSTGREAVEVAKDALAIVPLASRRVSFGSWHVSAHIRKR